MCLYNSLELGGTTALPFPAGDYSDAFEVELPLTFPRVPGPQNYFFQIALTENSPPNAVNIGGFIGSQQVFPVANITIVDDGELSL